MYRFRQISRHLAVQQGLRVGLITLAISFLFFVTYAAVAVHLAISGHLELRSTIRDAMRGPLTSAIWSFDRAGAYDIISSFQASYPIVNIVVTDDHSRVFVETVSRNTLPEGSATLAWMVKHFFTLSTVEELPLSHGEDGVIGEASVFYDLGAFTGLLLERLAHLGAAVTLIGLVSSVVIGMAFHRFLARPIIALSQQVDRMNPNDPATGQVLIPPVHGHNELGRFLALYNRSLDRLAEVTTELRHLATRDPLTDLPNRTLMTEIIDQVIADRKADAEGQCAVLFLDLDLFKHVNDSLGHYTGDKVLMEVGDRLNATIQLHGTVGRLGGDEFVLVVDRYQDPKTLARIAERVIACVRAPISVDHHPILINTSVGIACWPDNGETAQDLIRAADTAMYAAKSRGPGQWQFFSRDMTEKALIRMRTEVSLRNAVDNREFVVHYQPKLDLESGAITGVEALVRWQSAGQMVPPGRFIPIAEETGLIYDIGLFVLDEACAQLNTWKAAGTPLSVAVNVSAVQLGKERFLEDVVRILRQRAIDTSLLELEITESAVMHQMDSRLGVLHKLRDLGVRLAVDDFGTGYSSLSYLKQLPVDVLKIDRSFVIDLPQDTSIARMILNLAAQIDLKTVAEGVEREDQLDWLRTMGCSQVQGYLISRPVPAAEMPLVWPPEQPGHKTPCQPPGLNGFEDLGALDDGEARA